jgi:hypothetical protein
MLVASTSRRHWVVVSCPMSLLRVGPTEPLTTDGRLPPPHPQDMWTEITPGTILEVKYFRYFRFLPQGRLLYMLTHASPPDAIRMFKVGGGPSRLVRTSCRVRQSHKGPTQGGRLPTHGRGCVDAMLSGRLAMRLCAARGVLAGGAP